MTPFEEDLKKALARQEPSAGFTSRVMAQVAAERKAPNRWPDWRLAAAAAAILFLAGGSAYRQYEHRVQGEEAKQKLLLAMHIAGSKLQEAQQQVIRIESPEVSQ